MSNVRPPTSLSEELEMKKPLPRHGCQAAMLLALGMPNVFADAQINAPPQTENVSRTAAKPQQAGELTIADRYGKKTRIDVHVSSPENAIHRAYTSGDSVDATSQVTAVRMGEHVAIVKAGNLWQFPLTPNASGAAEVEFDGVGIVTRVSWKVTTASDDRTLVEADVLIPVYSTGYSPQLARLTGVWRATFDSTFPIPVRSELKARLNVRPAGDELTTASWIPR